MAASAGRIRLARGTRRLPFRPCKTYIIVDSYAYLLFFASERLAGASVSDRAGPRNPLRGARLHAGSEMTSPKEGCGGCRK